MDTNKTAALIAAENLTKTFTQRAGRRKKTLRAVDGVSISLQQGETLGLVGESGCGKSTLGRLLLRLTEPDSGSIFYNGKDITKAPMDPYRRDLQIIFQDPAGSLDPKMRVGDIVAEGPSLHKMCADRKEALAIAKEKLMEVGLGEECLYRLPGSFSGGQQQRIAIARALAVSPRFIVCDEPVSSLDVSYQAQILNLLSALQKKLGLTYLFISHDLNVVRRLSDRIAVMYLGRIVEQGPADSVCREPLHPYTKALLAAVPVPDPDVPAAPEGLADISTELPEKGCSFMPRCPYAAERCEKEKPELRDMGNGHFCACFTVKENPK